MPSKRVVLDVGQRTAKVDFSYDQNFIVYMATNDGKTNLGLYVTRVRDGATLLIEEMGENESLTFPSFLPNGNVLVLRIQNDEYKLQEFALSSDAQ